MSEYLCIAPDVKLGEGVKLSKFINLYGCEVGDNTKIGAFVEIQTNARVGRRCKISSHTFICEGVTIEDEVFIGHGVTFIDRDEALLLEEQLFPKGSDERDFKQMLLGLAVVALHSALETYGAAIGLTDHGPLPLRINAYLQNRRVSDLKSELADRLTELDETRDVA